MMGRLFQGKYMREVSDMVMVNIKSETAGRGATGCFVEGSINN